MSETKVAPKFTQGPWVLTADEESGEFTIRMGTFLEDAGTFESQDEIRWDSGLYPEDGEQYEEALANAVLATAAPGMYAALSIGIPAAERTCEGPVFLRAVAALIGDLSPGHAYIDYLNHKADAEEKAIAQAINAEVGN